MIPFVVTLIIGIIILIISCFIVEKPTDDINTVTKVETEGLKKSLEHSLQEVSEDTIMKAEDELSKLSNEKIIAVNDFSNLVIEKINQNHEEVVFLYNMLNEKETEIKEVIKKADDAKKEIIDTPKQVFDKVSITQEENVKDQIIVSDTIEKNHDITKIEEIVAQGIKEEPSEIDIIYDDLGLNNNDKILMLYKEGKSVMEIAKLLELGQGEVKLVIDLFR